MASLMPYCELVEGKEGERLALSPRQDKAPRQDKEPRQYIKKRTWTSSWRGGGVFSSSVSSSDPAAFSSFFYVQRVGNGEC